MHEIEKVTGPIPPSAGDWMIFRRISAPGGGEKWDLLYAFAADGSDAKVNRFPVELLHGPHGIELLRETFGAGKYRIAWHRGIVEGLKEPHGQLRLKYSRTFELEARAAPAARAPEPRPAPAPAAPPSLDTTEGIFRAAREVARETVAITQNFCQLQIELIRADAAARIAEKIAENDRRERQDRAHYLEIERLRARSDRQLAQDRAALAEEYEPEPEPQPLAALPQAQDVPLGGMVTQDGRLSVPHLIQALGPKALDMLGEFIADKKKAAAEIAAKAAE